MSEGENTQTAHLVFDLGEKKKKRKLRQKQVVYMQLHTVCS